MTAADRARAFRARRAAEAGRAPGRAGRPPAVCGTASAYKRHRRLGEDCAVCRAAWAADSRTRYNRKGK
jgi:hypothetical protein